MLHGFELTFCICCLDGLDWLLLSEQRCLAPTLGYTCFGLSWYVLACRGGVDVALVMSVMGSREKVSLWKIGGVL